MTFGLLRSDLTLFALKPLTETQQRIVNEIYLTIIYRLEVETRRIQDPDDVI